MQDQWVKQSLRTLHKDGPWISLNNKPTTLINNATTFSAKASMRDGGFEKEWNETNRNFVGSSVQPWNQEDYTAKNFL